MSASLARSGGGSARSSRRDCSASTATPRMRTRWGSASRFAAAWLPPDAIAALGLSGTGSGLDQDRHRRLAHVADVVFLLPEHTEPAVDRAEIQLDRPKPLHCPH